MYKLNPLALAISMTLLTACGSSDDNPPVVIDTLPVAEDTPISYALKLVGGTEYLISQDSIVDNELTAEGTGTELLNWNFFYPVGNTLFISTYEDNSATAYKVDANNEVVKLASFIPDNTLTMFGSVNNDTLLASDTSASGHTQRLFYTVDAETGLVTDKVNYTIHDTDTGTPGEGTIAWPTALVVREDTLFIPFQKLSDDGNWSTPDADTAYVAIYDYPLTEGAAPRTIISDDRTSNIGANGFTSNLITTESGDLYSLSNGALSAGFSPASTKPSGILRILNNEEEFDANYFFNVEEAVNGGKLFWFDYVGDNKALARIIVNEEGASAWSAYSKELLTQKLVIIDLVTQTITDVADVPLHQKRYTSPIEVMDGKVYVSIETAEEAFVYQVDIDSATAIKTSEIKGKTIKGFFDLYN